MLSKLSWLLSFSALWVMVLAGTGCDDGNTDGDADGDVDGDTDVDGDVDGDTDVDGDVDGDGDGDGCLDEDEDGYGDGCSLGDDCDDDAPAVNPGAEEICNGVDDDCDGETDEDLGGPACEMSEGVCVGAVASCDGAGGWAECGAAEYGDDYEAIETLCDGLDNDCDGSTDEADCPCTLGETQPCGIDEGACELGEQACSADGLWGACTGGVGPMGETCNGVDDDCDGTVDDAVDLTPQACSLQEGVCTGAMRTCGGAGGWSTCSGTASYGDDYEAAETRCDGLDNDCDGVIDEGCTCVDEDTQDCGTDQGACVSGTQTCTSGAWGACAGEVAPTTETCNGADDDCDGAVDEGLVAPTCPLSEGVCAGATQPCDGASGFGACAAEDYGPDYEATESSCDGLDNDCDNEVDEGCACIDGRTQECGSATGACERGLQTCASGAWGACSGGVTPVTETCNGADDDCNGTSDDNLTAPACALTQGVCADAVQQCGGDSGWVPCSGTDSYGPNYVANEDGGAVELLCDGLDNDCDGEIDEACISGPIVSGVEDTILPSLYGNHMVFLGNPDGNWDVFFSDLRTGETLRLTETAEDEMSPQVHGNQVVFTRGADDAIRAVLIDLEAATETVLTTGPSASPRINRGLVVFEDARGSTVDIYYRDLISDTEDVLVSSTGYDGSPDIRVPYLAYVTDETGTFVTHLVDLGLGTDTAVTASPAGDQSGPRVDFSVFGWTDGRDTSEPIDAFSDWQIYGASIDTPTTEAALVTAAGSQILGDIHGALFAWSDYRGGNWDVVVSWIGGEEFFLTSNDAAQADPAIHGNIIVWEDNRLGSFDIYGSSFTVNEAEVGQVTINELLADPPSGADVNGDGAADTSDDEFVELTNVTGSALDISGFTLSDALSVVHVFPAGTVIPAGGALLVFGDGAPAGLFGGVTFQVSSTGSLSLNNTGDTITLANAAGTTIDTVTYGSAANNDASLVRVPEYTGALTRHDLDASSEGRPYSPGLVRDGFAF